MPDCRTVVTVFTATSRDDFAATWSLFRKEAAGNPGRERPGMAPARVNHEEREIAGIVAGRCLEEFDGVVRYFGTQFSAADEFVVIADAVAAVFLRVVQSLVGMTENHDR